MKKHGFIYGNPRLVQDEDYYFSKLKDDSYSFLFQVDEDGYPDAIACERL
ncbi:hypothetical protein [Paenibacillus sp. DMB20]|nr:hypothetical protein [Paenibacillus sp. DMB20]